MLCRRGRQLRVLGTAITFSCALSTLRVMTAPWACPQCQRQFARKNQRHACGTGERSQVLRNRPAALVALYAELEAFINQLGKVEIVARERYVLFRSTRIFADLTVMTDALRLVIHLSRRVEHVLVEKVVDDRRQLSHVVKLRDARELHEMKPLLREAYQRSISA